MAKRHGMLAVVSWSVAVAVALHGCGSTPGPSEQPPPPPPPSPDEAWSIAGTVVTTVTGAPVAGATVKPEIGDPVQTDAAGRFRLASLANPASSSLRATVEATGHLTRELYFKWQTGARTDVTVDLISTAAPFSLGFYQAFVRNAYEEPTTLEPLERWTVSPRIYVRTVDQEGRPIEREVLEVVLPALGKAVRDFSSGRLSVAALETGTETRTGPKGWIIVNIIRDEASDACGWAYVAADPGRITLVNDLCSCGSTKISGTLVAHEVGHAMGFWHVPDRSHVMYRIHPRQCPAGTLSTAERHHVAIAYSRWPGNEDPDCDARAGALARGRRTEVIN